MVHFPVCRRCLTSAAFLMMISSALQNPGTMLLSTDSGYANVYTYLTGCNNIVLVQCCLTSTGTIGTVRDGEPRTATLTFTQLRML